MKKLLAIMLLAGTASFYACSPQETGTVGVESDAVQNDGSNNGIVYPAENDTTDADVVEKTQTSVGNSKTRGEENHSKSQTTKNVTVHPDSSRNQ